MSNAWRQGGGEADREADLQGTLSSVSFNAEPLTGCVTRKVARCYMSGSARGIRR